MRRSTTLLLGVTGVFFSAGLTLALLWSLESDSGAATLPRRQASPAPTLDDAPRQGRRQQFWENGRLRSDISYRDDVYDGNYRTYFDSGSPYELRHYRLGHEEGLQQSWSEDGTLYLNYEIHDGRRFGLVNPAPCNTVGDDTLARPPRSVPIDADVAAREREGSRSRFVEGYDRNALPYYDDASFTPRWTPARHTVGAFSFDTQTGGTVSDRRLRGRPYVASFIYTQCAAVCPLLVSQLSRVARTFSAEQAHIVSFSVTPDTDTPEALARFGRERGIDASRWSLATGSKREIYSLARTSFFADDARVGSAVDDETAFLHTEKLILVDAGGRLRGVYNGTQPHAVDQLIGDLLMLTAGSER